MSKFDSTSTFDQGVFTFYSISLAILFVLGLLLHFVSLKVLVHHEHKSRKLTPYLFNVCISNCFCLLLHFPLVFVATLQKNWASLGRASCCVSGITLFACSTVMIVTLALMNVKIYHSLIRRDAVHQHEHNHFTSHRRFLLIWTCSVVIVIPTVLGWNSIVPDGPHCSVNWHAESFVDASYLVVQAFVSFVIPIVVSCLYSVKIHRYVSQDGHHVSTFTMQQIRTRALYIRASKITAVVVMIFVLLWLPYWMNGFFTLFAVKTTKQPELAILPWLFVSISVVYVPLVFTTMDKRFRRSLVKLFCGQRSHRQVNPTISVDRFESSDAALPSCYMATPRTCSPSNMIPRSPLVNRSSFRMSLIEDVTSEIVSRQKPLQIPTLNNEAVTRLIRSSLHAAHELHEDYTKRGGIEHRRNTAVA